MKCSYCINFIIWFTTILAAQPADLSIDSLLVQAQQQLDSLQYQKAIDLSQKMPFKGMSIENKDSMTKPLHNISDQKKIAYNYLNNLRCCWHKPIMT